MSPPPFVQRRTAPLTAAFRLLLASAATAACGATGATGAAIPPSTLSAPAPLIADAALGTGTFYRAFASPDAGTRETAYLYLLGVQDLTEGRSWCDYRGFKTVTLREVVGEYIQSLPRHRLDERAAVVIEEALRARLPCQATTR